MLLNGQRLKIYEHLDQSMIIMQNIDKTAFSQNNRLLTRLGIAQM